MVKSPLAGRVALVPAASKGLGRGSAEELVRLGASVAICSRNEEAVSRTAGEISGSSGRAVHCSAVDLDDAADVARWVDDVAQEVGPPSILILNSGGPRPARVTDCTEDDFRLAYDQVVSAAVRLVNLALPYMRDGRWGRIVSISSVTAREPLDDLALSVPARAALLGYLKLLAREVGQFGTTVNSLLVGYVMTDRLAALVESAGAGSSADEQVGAMRDASVLREIGKVQDVAAAAGFLCSPSGGFITGAALPVDGGLLKSIH